MLDSELFGCMYTQTQYYTLTTPIGSSGSKNKRPNNTHLNLGGTQMSPVFLEPHQVLLQLPMSFMQAALFCVFILCCSQYCMACLSCDPYSPWDIVEIGPWGTYEPVKKHPLVSYTIYFTQYTHWDCHESSQGNNTFRNIAGMSPTSRYVTDTVPIINDTFCYQSLC